jgi:hypothetical protein
MTNTDTTARTGELWKGIPLDPSLREFYIDADGIAHGDLFCSEVQAPGSWLTQPVSYLPENGCHCAADALAPVAGSYRDTGSNAGPNTDAPDNSGTGTGRSADRVPVSEKQAAFIASLLDQTGAQLADLGHGDSIDALSGGRGGTASIIIDKLLGMKDHVKVEAPAAPVDGEALDTEAFGAIADSLGRKFEVTDLTPALRAFAQQFASGYTGTFDFMLDMKKAANGKGLSDGQAKGTLNCARADWSRSGGAKAEAEVATVAPGRYAYTADDGHTVFVKVWKSGTGASYLAGGGLDGELVEAGVVPRSAKASVFGKIAADPAAAAALFGEKASRCSRCGRGLSDEDNPYFAEGYGPDCGALVHG